MSTVGAVDFKRFKLPDWLLVGGGAVVFLFGFFDWFDTGAASSSAFKFTLTGVIPWLLIVGSALLSFQIRTGMLRVQKWPWPTIFLLATAVGAILILVRAIMGADGRDFNVPDEITFDRKFTLWFSLIGALAAAAGAALGFIAAGGTVNDLPLGRIIAAATARRAAKAAVPADPAERGSRDPGRRLPPAEQDRPLPPRDDRDGRGAPPPFDYDERNP